MIKRLALFVLLLPLAGCSNWLVNMAGDPPALYELEAPATIATPLPLVASQLLIDVPVASAGIDTPRVALIQADGTMAYYRNVSWTDRAPVMMQTLLVQSFSNSGKLPAVGRENVGLRADYLLKTDLSSFEANYGAGGVPSVKVRINAKLIGMPRRIIVAGQEFIAEVPATSDTVLAVRDAFQQASDQALAELVNWVLGQLQPPARSARH